MRHMARTVGIGHQDFETIRKNSYFYIDKPSFIREWWENGGSCLKGCLSDFLWEYQEKDMRYYCKAV